MDSFYGNVFTNHFGPEIAIKTISSVPGGCINQTSKVTTNQGLFFIKVNSENLSDLFEKEQLGLELLGEKSSLGVPKVLTSGTQSGKSYLILEWIEKGIANQNFWELFGQKLAEQHKVTSDQFGLDHENHIGRLPQSNNYHGNWTEFFVEERLKPQLKIARDSGLVGNATMQQFYFLFLNLNELIPEESPAFLHGDLWSGNFMCGPNSSPYIFDPAIYFGHREAEIAFTTMFGGFDQEFYSSYEEEFPLQPGFEDRVEIHNLYPLLVHVNLFGPSYLPGIEGTLKRFA